MSYCLESELLEEVVALVIHENECREVLDGNLPYCFHSEFRVFDTLYTLAVVLGEDCGRTAYASEVESAVFVSGIGNDLATVTLGKHNH